MIPQPFVALVIQVITGVVLYGLLGLWFRLKGMEEILNVIKKVRG